MNILSLLTPKAKLAYLDSSMTVRQALEKMRAHGYSSIPMIEEKTGIFLGSLSEGDLLWKIVEEEKFSLRALETSSAKALLRPSTQRAAKIDARLEDILELLLQENFVPVIDDRDILVGIVTRRSVLGMYLHSTEIKE